MKGKLSSKKLIFLLFDFSNLDLTNLKISSVSVSNSVSQFVITVVDLLECSISAFSPNEPPYLIVLSFFPYEAMINGMFIPPSSSSISSPVIDSHLESPLDWDSEFSPFGLSRAICEYILAMGLRVFQEIRLLLLRFGSSTPSPSEMLLLSYF